ncbi:dephospho-CoA kinase [Dulcicalothrix desertica PCC 7102]|uniref:Dephospho-CoA kinase n=1 Tax=Dulcicalothrix desertica PCC 7102 TaxID=232991 RepID=A0A433V3F5_9CYAN|nr:dephospho-CoA kinase [Dulcicalothrix desertica]RUT00609.1 dephospho-CoA kinase [Dulcicalothrix desertica PCC 7102]TWH53248.1 dephospho-CoA kinase [Dulcicalothrix desertica PCC 7102]
MKRIIGLTGGIATGKSTVANYLEKTYKFPILDADMYAREAVAANSFILNKIAQRYGQDILLNNELNRAKLGEIIFNNGSERLWVESLIHPYVKERFNQEIIVCSSNILVLVIPLLFEVGMTDLTTEIWVVSCLESQQLERLIQRNNLTLEQAQARIKSQMPLAEKIARADVVLDNSHSLDTLLKQVDIVIKTGEYKTYA